MNVHAYRGLGFATALLIAWPLAGSAAPQSGGNAVLAVKGWLHETPAPLGTHLSQKKLAAVRTFKDQRGSDLYHVVSLQPGGYVITSADSDVEPIVAFSENGVFDPRPGNPLAYLVEHDLSGRLGQLPPKTAVPGSGAVNPAPAKWRRLTQPAGAAPLVASKGSSLDDVRVSPFIQTRWNQSNLWTGSKYISCYNYYSPPFAPGDINNYVCGCNNTAWAQIMRYFEYPTQSVGTESFTIKVDGVESQRSLRGGDGLGGAYVWTLMPLVPNAGISQQQRQAIGALTADIGAVSGTDYSSSGSSAGLEGTELIRVFHYGNAILGGWDPVSHAWGDLSQYPVAANANLDARLPVFLAISGDSGGHAVVCDGYGYNQAVPYHHLNLGWGGSDDAWYNLPTVETGSYSFTAIMHFYYNIFTNGCGEIVSGRVLDSNNTPLGGATVHLVGGGQDRSTLADSRGIYAFSQVPSSTAFMIDATKAGFACVSNNVTTGNSQSRGATGNKWGVSFVLLPAATNTVVANPSNGGSVSGGGIFAVGSSQEMSAYANAGWTFMSWGDGNAENPRTIIISSGGSTYTAYFALETQQTAILTVGGATGGTALGGGTYPVGQVVSISAVAASGWHFTQWQDGNTENPRSVVAPFGGATYTASFALNPSTIVIADPGPQAGSVGVMFALPLDIASGSALGSVTVSGLPSGLKYNATQKAIAGVPTAAVTNKTVTVSARNKAGGVTTLSFTMTLDSLPTWAFGAFSGWYKAGGDDVGVASMTVTKAGKVSGKCSLTGTNYTFSAVAYTNGSSPVSGFRFIGNAKAGKTSVPVSFEVSPRAAAGGPASLGVAEGRLNGVAGGNAPLVLYRNVWSDPDMKPVATNQDGYYTATVPGDGSFGSGYLAFTLKKGAVKAAGKMADGKAVSLGSTLLVDESNRFFTVLYSAPTTYKGGYFFGVTEFLRPGAGEPLIMHPLAGDAFVWKTLDPKATSVYGEGFNREVGLVGGWYDKLGNLCAYYTNVALSVGTSSEVPELLVGTNRYGSVFWNPEGQALSVVTNARGLLTGLMAPRTVPPVRDDAGWHYDSGSNMVGLVFTLTRPTGIFKGAFKAWFDYGTTHTSKSIAFEGVLTPEREDMNDGIEGCGFYLWQDLGQYTDALNHLKTYPFKWSYDFLLFSSFDR